MDALLCEPAPAGPRPALVRRMTRCECAGLGFQELLQCAREQGLSPAEACRRTGCGQTCTACIPDLEHFLAHQPRR